MTPRRRYRPQRALWSSWAFQVSLDLADFSDTSAERGAVSGGAARAGGIGLDAEAAREDIGRGSGRGGYWTRSGRRGILYAGAAGK